MLCIKQFYLFQLVYQPSSGVVRRETTTSWWWSY